MKLSDFDYNLPRELIAQYPEKERDTARLLVLDRSKRTIEHRIFKDVVDYCNKGDLFVLNDTKVLRSRLLGSRLTGGRVEVLLLNQKYGKTFNCLIKPSRIRLGEKIVFGGGGSYGIISAKNEITFNTKDAQSIYNLGVMPLPPYIKRKPQDLDTVYYQTVFAKEEGAVASPTAGLHFTQGLIQDLESRGVNIAHITLHIGLSTFKPVKVEDISRHKMESEYFRISTNTVRQIEEAHRDKKRIFSVGTTSLRALETYCSGIKEGYTDLFIYPGYKFHLGYSLLTNFHLPRTTLFMLVCAFAGRNLIRKAYQEAMDKRYRFYSYGDAMLII